MTSIKTLPKIYKFFIYEIFKLIYGNVNSIYDISQTSEVFEEKYLYQNNYKIYFCKNARLYTDTIHDLALIKDNQY